jgi:anti-anti-sigma regulatory factor
MDLLFQHSPNTLNDLKHLLHRVRIFLLVLAGSGLPLFILSILDYQKSSTAFYLMLALYGVYVANFALSFTRWGLLATYCVFAILVFSITFGIHLTMGALSVMPVLYMLLLIGVTLVINRIGALDSVMVWCLLGYGALVAYEYLVEAPGAFTFTNLNDHPLDIIAMTIIAVFVISFLCCWFMVRVTVLGLQRSNEAVQGARQAAEERTEEKAHLLEQLQETNQSLVSAQQTLRATIDALSLPLIPLNHGIALLPLVGYIDGVRAEGIQQALLEGIHRLQARYVIIDITGIPSIDQTAAQALIQAVRAAQLLGTQVVMSGISASIAEHLIRDHISLQGIATISSLGEAIQYVAQQPLQSRMLGGY